jgi:hypothetical protein
MSLSSASVGWRKRSRTSDEVRTSSFGTVRDFLIYYMVEQPLAAVATVWLLCFPMVYHIYGDAFQSAATLAHITIWFLVYLVTVVTVMTLIALAVEYAFSRRARWMGRR